ncbi:MAG: NADH-quinone oxidoreductase subunit NuoE [FCB group bacterium]|nr:NADH-quinone oxidoreductase subunit NuoE [FCB group bacterium]
MKEQLDNIIAKYEGKKGITIPLLQDVQEREGYVSTDMIRYLSEKTGIPVAEWYGVATFYSMFRLQAQGRHIIRTCKGTACHVSGADVLIAAIRNHLKLNEGENTTHDGRFTLLEVACLGCCSLAPVIMIDETTYGKVTVAKLPSILDNYE